MHTVVRHYKGNSLLFDEIVKRASDVESIIRGVDGFVAYYLVRTSDGGFSVSVFDDEAGTVESTQRAAAYLKENLSEVAGAPPELIEGETIMHFNR